MNNNSLKGRNLLIIVLAAIIIAFLYYLNIAVDFVPLQYDLKLGEIASRDIIAPYDFKLYKSEEELESQQKVAALSVKPIYKISQNLIFNALKNLDFIFKHFNNTDEERIEKIQRNLLSNGYNLSLNSIKYLQDEQNQATIYNKLTDKLQYVFEIGIYPENYSKDKIKVFRNNKISEYTLNRLFSISEAKNYIIDSFSSITVKRVVSELLDHILIENLIIDQERTKIARERAREKVSPVKGKILKNEKIISKNNKITSDDLLKLNSLIKAQKQKFNSKTKNQLYTSSFGIFLLSFLIFISYFFILTNFFDKKYSSSSLIIANTLSIILILFLILLLNSYLKLSALFIPIPFAILSIIFITDYKVGLIYNFILITFCTIFLNWNLTNPILLSLTTISGYMVIKRSPKKVDYFPLAIAVFVFYIFYMIIFALIKFKSFNTIIQHFLFGSVSLIVSFVALILIVPIIERKLNIASQQILLEFLHFDNPLLQKMSKITPGTYHHSLIVGNLAESAAEAIGANHLVARVGSYYHDIGKIEHPELFIENNPDSDKEHEKLLADESAKKIRQHISDGITLAKRYNLPKVIIDIIKQHHGTSQIKYFYNEAKKTGLDINEEDFHYNGPKPKTKEAAIVMIADIVESTTKSLKEIDEQKVKEILDKTIYRLINEKQLDESPITLKELKTIKTYMLPIIMGIYRKRIEYPDE